MQMHNKLNCKESWCITLSYFLLLGKQLLKREVNNYTFTKLWHNILRIIFYNCKFTYLVVLARHSLSVKKTSLLFTTLFSVNIALMNTNRDHNDISHYDARKSYLIIILTILITTSPRKVPDNTVTRKENFHFGLRSG